MINERLDELERMVDAAAEGDEETLHALLARPCLA